MATYGAQVKNGELLVEMAAREAARRKHKPMAKVSAMELIEVLTELGFKIVVAAPEPSTAISRPLGWGRGATSSP